LVERTLVLQLFHTDSSHLSLLHHPSCALSSYAFVPDPLFGLLKFAVPLDAIFVCINIGLEGEKSLIWVEGDAEALKFEDNSMDGYTIAFGIRNVTHIEKALAEAYRQVTD